MYVVRSKGHSHSVKLIPAPAIDWLVNILPELRLDSLDPQNKHVHARVYLWSCRLMAISGDSFISSYIRVMLQQRQRHHSDDQSTYGSGCNLQDGF